MTGQIFSVVGICHDLLFIIITILIRAFKGSLNSSLFDDSGFVRLDNGEVVGCITNIQTLLLAAYEFLYYNTYGLIYDMRRGFVVEKVLLLLDTSGSMYGEKISALNYATSRFVCGLESITLLREPLVAVITFGGKPVESPFVPLGQFAIVDFEAKGETRLSEALRKAAAEAAPDTMCLLISDGLAMDGDFLKIQLECPAYAIAIGYDADIFMLSRFTGASERVFPPGEAEMLPGYLMQRDFNAME